jgi:hypothetical protein
MNLADFICTHPRLAGGTRQVSVVLATAVRVAVTGVGAGLGFIRSGITHDPRRGVLIAVRSMIDEILLGKLEALRLATACFIDR